MKTYNKPIYYIGTKQSSNLMTIRTYVEEYNPAHNYDYMVCSFNLQDIVNKFNLTISTICTINQSPTSHQNALIELNNFNPYKPIEK